MEFLCSCQAGRGPTICRIQRNGGRPSGTKSTQHTCDDKNQQRRFAVLFLRSAAGISRPAMYSEPRAPVKIDRRSFCALALGASLSAGLSSTKAAEGNVRDFRRTVHFNSASMHDPNLPVVERPTTFGLALRLEDEPIALRIGFANDIALDYSITAVAARTSAGFGDGFNPVGNAPWTLLTANAGGRDLAEDASSPGAMRSLMVHGNGGDSRVPNVSWTDWSPIQSIPSDEPGRPILFVRASVARWVSPRACPAGGAFNESPIARGRKLICTLSVGEDHATSPATSSAPGIAGVRLWPLSPFFSVQYVGRSRGATVLWGGDSHFAGDTTPGNIGAFPLLSCLELSTPEYPFSAANYAWGGSPSDVFMPVLERMLEACRPRFLIVQGWTANDGPSEAAAMSYFNRAIALARSARLTGTEPILVTRFSRVTLFQHPSELATANRLRFQQLALNGIEFPVIDAALVLDDPARPGAFKPGLSEDGVHPNAQGHAAVAALLTPVLRRVMTTGK